MGELTFVPHVMCIKSCLFCNLAIIKGTSNDVLCNLHLLKPF